MKSILFLIHGTAPKPVGGVKIVYQYANMLVQKGYGVTVLFGEKRKAHVSPVEWGREFFKYIIKKITRYDKRTWFSLDKRVNLKYVFEFSAEKCAAYDVLVATMLSTSYHLAALRLKSCTKYLYFVQGFEAWNASKPCVLDSYRLPLKKIAISPWLYDVIKSVDDNVVYIPNGFDFTYFSLLQPIVQRTRYEIAMLYHENSRKRCADTFAALDIVKQKFPNLHVNMFGAFPAPRNLPSWYSYTQKPNKAQHNAIYNASAIFVNASEQEGWGLTVGEAMICGCAVVCSDNQGHLIMAKDEDTALVFKVGAIEQMASQIERLILDDALRCALAERGNKFIQQFSWEKSLEKFIAVIEGGEKEQS